MTLQAAALLTDENIHPDVVRFLEEQGHDVLDVKREGLVGSSDRELIQRARSEERVIVPHDRDFGRLMFAQGASIGGILFIRPGHVDPAHTIATLRAVLAAEIALDVPFTLVAERRGEQVNIRVRRLD